MKVVNKIEIKDVETSVSEATKRNWARLGVNEHKKRCAARANKRLSDKHIMPKESFNNLSNAIYVEQIIELAKNKQYKVNEIIFVLGLELARRASVSQENIEYLTSEYSTLLREPLFSGCHFPENEDWLSLVYQYMQTEGEKNSKGSYYTPKSVVADMVNDILLSKSDKVLDPCCGGGAFLLNIPNIRPNQIYGVDFDPIAVMISKFNYFLKFPTTTILPQIYCADFLEETNLLSRRTIEYQNVIEDNRFEYIITNPPWGAISINCSKTNQEITSGETFSHFIVKSFQKLQQDGALRFLLPSSVLNVKVHQDVRKFLVQKTNLSYVKIYQSAFTGVMTQYVAIKAQKRQPEQSLFFENNSKISIIKKESLNQDNFYVMNFITSDDDIILNKVQKQKTHDLSNAVWALGIVTGDNKNKLVDKPQAGMEPIYTGKEIAPYKMKTARKYILYDRANFQQVASDDIYRAPVKLAYKFISNKLIFSIDTSGQLFLNSANLLIPNIPGMSIKTVAAFLNSELYQFFYKKRFGGIKILKSNLLLLPFMSISSHQDAEITNLVEAAMLSDECDDSRLQRYIYNLFNITDEEILYIKGELNGNT